MGGGARGGPRSSVSRIRAASRTLGGMQETAIDETPGFRLGDGEPRFSVRSTDATAVTLVVQRPGDAQPTW